jgi:hypothetical protein
MRPSIPAATGSLATPNENAAVASHIQLNGAQFNYTATTGHLTASDVKTGQASVSFFYVAYTVANADAAKRPVIFFYNGGPGSASTYLHLGSFGPRRLVSTIPQASIPPVQLVDNQKPCWPAPTWCSSTPSAPATRKPLPTPTPTSGAWTRTPPPSAILCGATSPSTSAKPRPNSCSANPTARRARRCWPTCWKRPACRSTGWCCSAIMDYNSNCGVLDPNAISCEGYIPTYALTSAYHGRGGVPVDSVRSFAAGGYRTAIAAYLASNVAPPPPCSASCPT